ncbi:hypothetical protein [Ponticaulis sp.]|uniref:hypothetical protein n=1 Tax=Ponticaulis sp. TaxID=2020902 RepID=UPI000B6F1D4F|nr:hypothetical protein [Ponticaulis sp.]MAJ07756.1 hypothetical protein [Ponticaulis sp.]MAJ08660.1 hypothetical protein [Ponticaulis sp.]HBH91239.1 hypothetical protein [Hyphomonadaceae bacterium]HBJ93395.1 hypothetical protein [Hyphomonadaceae bacterium]|tara:strand:- start:1574 stop:1960 length:387 start_codon:yes stop_codon:yes gene_type:complete
MDVMSELRELYDVYNTEDFRSGLQRLRQIWYRIPEPKVDTANAYLILEDGVAFALKCGDLDEAQWWATHAPDFAKKRKDRGEVEFLVGKVALERGELEAAREWFLISNVKSEGRIFEGEDKKYAQLIR